MHSSSLLVAFSQRLVKSTLSTIGSIRNEASFHAIFKAILKKKKEHLEISRPVLLRKRHTLIHFEVNEVEPEYPNTEQDRHRSGCTSIDLASFNS